MRKIVFIFLLFPFILFGQAKSIVVGGVDVDINDYPWQVALSSSASGAGFCGG